MRAAMMGVVVLLLGCHPKPTVTSVTTVARLGLPAIRADAYSTAVRPACKESGLMQVKCMFAPDEHTGCVIARFDDAKPLAREPCEYDDDHLVISKTPDVAVELASDPVSHRWAWRVGGKWSVGGLIRGHLRGNDAESEPTLDWRKAPRFEGAMADDFERWERKDQIDFLANLRETGEPGAFVRFLGLVSHQGPEWEIQFDRLDEDDQHTLFSQRLTEQSGDEFYAWYDRELPKHPAFKPWLKKAVLDALDRSDWSTIAPWLRRALAEKDADAGPIACRVLEQREIANVMRPPQQNLPFLVKRDGAIDFSIWLALYVTRYACPAEEEDFYPCDPELRCWPDDQPDPDAADQYPLCETTDLSQVTEEMATMPLPNEIALEQFTSMLKHAELHRRGLDKDLQPYNQRRLYKVSNESIPESCAGLSFREAACRLSPGQIRAHLQGCELEVDDARKTLTLRESISTQDLLRSSRAVSAPRRP